MLDDELVIETPERVELHYVLANVGNRFLAAAIDHLIQAVLLLGVVLALSAVDGFSEVERLAPSEGWALGIGVFAVFAIYWGYFVIFETLWNGQTPGKRLMRLRVVREDGPELERECIEGALEFMGGDKERRAQPGLVPRRDTTDARAQIVCREAVDDRQRGRALVAGDARISDQRAKPIAEDRSKIAIERMNRVRNLHASIVECAKCVCAS